MFLIRLDFTRDTFYVVQWKLITSIPIKAFFERRKFIIQVNLKKSVFMAKALF